MDNKVRYMPELDVDEGETTVKFNEIGKLSLSYTPYQDNYDTSSNINDYIFTEEKKSLKDKILSWIKSFL